MELTERHMARFSPLSHVKTRTIWQRRSSRPVEVDGSLLALDLSRRRGSVTAVDAKPPCLTYQVVCATET